MSRPLSFVINLLCKMLSRRKEHKQPIGYVDELVNILKNGLANPRSMEKRLKEYLKDYDFNGVSVLDEREIEEIRIRLTTQFTQPERDALRPICTEMLKEARRLKGRPFLQVMCGASAKSSDSQKSRCYNLFRISFQNGEWLFRSERFTWDWGLQAFSAPLIEQLTFARP